MKNYQETFPGRALSASTMASCKTRLFCAIAASIILSHGSASTANSTITANTEKRPLTARAIVSGLDHPWSIAFIATDDWLVTERSGSLRRVLDGKLQAQAITGLAKISAIGQGGLLDVVLHPNFAHNRLVYLSYVAAENQRHGTEVMRGRLVDNSLKDTQIIFKALPKVHGDRHFGSRLAFDHKGMLYISLGDRGSKAMAQNLSQHPGSIVRLHDDGKTPDDNPFVHHENALPEIYSYGHRNVQGLTFDQQSNTLWAHEHGPQGGDELNRIVAGQNYGWPTISYGVNYGSGSKIGIGTKRQGMTQPITFWDPSIAPSGLTLVNSHLYPNWKNNLLVGALKFQMIARLELANSKLIHEERLLPGKLGRIRDIRQAPDGYIYLLTDSSDGKIYRLE